MSDAPANSPAASPVSAPADATPAPAPPAPAPAADPAPPAITIVEAPPAPAAPAAPVVPEPPSPASSVVFVEQPAPVKEAAPLPPPAFPTVTKAPTATKGVPLSKTMADAPPAPAPDTVTIVQTTAAPEKVVKEATKDADPAKPPPVVTVLQTEAPATVADKPVPKGDDTITVVKSSTPVKASLTIDIKDEKAKAAVKEAKAVEKQVKAEEKAAKKEVEAVKKAEKDIKKTSTIVVVAPEPVTKPSVVVVDAAAPPKVVLQEPTKTKPAKASAYELIEVDVAYRRRDRIRIKIEQLLAKLFGSSHQKRVGQSPYQQFSNSVRGGVNKEEIRISDEIRLLQHEWRVKHAETKAAEHRYHMALRAEWRKAETSTDEKIRYAKMDALSKLHKTGGFFSRDFSDESARGRTRQRQAYMAEADALREEANQRRSMKVGGQKLKDLKAKLEEMEETDVVEIDIS